MADNIFGANIIEIITEGLYRDSKVIYREYIQNACDQIDKAEQLGILKARDFNSKLPDLGEGVINIWLEPENRYIAIEDNATGIKANEFQNTLRKTADSDKVMGKDKGFRGIGKLCGLAYCKRLVFTSRWIDEDIVSIMSCDALKMRHMINEANTKVQRHSANDVLDSIIKFETRSATEKDSKHFFKVELIDINEENEELFGGNSEDNIQELIDYLSFVAPVPYHANFYYRSEIYDYVKENNLKIDEYVIKINGEQIFKKYKTHLKTGNGQDDVNGVEFHNFLANDDSHLGWMWFGKTCFKAAIKEEEISRGLRLRKENIQIGEDDTLRDMFTRDSSKRGNNYFIGEIFAVSPDLIPNSQRSYFNENPTRIEFEHELKDYFNNTLYYIYYDGSDINSSIKKINSYNEKLSEFQKKKAESGFFSPIDFEREEQDLKIKEKEAEKARNNLEKKLKSGRSILTTEIIERRSAEISNIVSYKTSDEQSKDNDKISSEITSEPPYKSKRKVFGGWLSSYNRNERKLLLGVLEKVFVIIRNTTDKKIAENIINKIKDELK